MKFSSKLYAEFTCLKKRDREVEVNTEIEPCTRTGKCRGELSKGVRVDIGLLGIHI